MSRVKRRWWIGEKPVNLTLLDGPLGIVEAEFWCPGCGQHVRADREELEGFFWCSCGARLRLSFAATLVELEEEG